MIHGHGNNLLAYGTAIRLDFSSNIAFNNHCDRILAHLQTQLDSIRNYPDPGATSLTQKLADHHALSADNILVTNGSAEAFYLVAHYLTNGLPTYPSTRSATLAPHVTSHAAHVAHAEFPSSLHQGPRLAPHHSLHQAPHHSPDTRTAICVPAFAEYEDACALHKHELTFIALEAFGDLDCSAYTSVWLGNPNNPNGAITAPETILRQCRHFPATIFVLDQAYVQLTSVESVDVLHHLSPAHVLPDNLIIIHSLTKEFAIPGLRLGYIAASQRHIETLTAMRPPWNVNALALAAGEYVLDNYSSLLPDKEVLLGESTFLQEALATIDGLTVFPSPCNFFLTRLHKGTAGELKSRLIHECGILIRDASNFRGLDAIHFRVAAQKREDNLQLVDALQNILQKIY